MCLKGKSMRPLQRFEAACGLIAALLGLVALASTLLGPLYQTASSSTASGSVTRGTANLIQVGVQPVTVVFFGLLLLVLIGVSGGAWLHSRTGENRWRRLLWIATAVLVAFLVLTLLSIGLFVLPSTLFALVASALSFGPRRIAPGERAQTAS